MEIESSPNLDSYDMYDRRMFLEEKQFNLFGYIPFVCVMFGGARALVGVVQLVNGVAAGTFHLLGDLFRYNPKGYGYRTIRNYSHINHGVLNIFRGVVEAITLIGLITFLYDLTGFRFSYEGELKYEEQKQILLNQLSKNA